MWLMDVDEIFGYTSLIELLKLYKTCSLMPWEQTNTKTHCLDWIRLWLIDPRFSSHCWNSFNDNYHYANANNNKNRRRKLFKLQRSENNTYPSSDLVVAHLDNDSPFNIILVSVSLRLLKLLFNGGDRYFYHRNHPFYSWLFSGWNFCTSSE